MGILLLTFTFIKAEVLTAESIEKELLELSINTDSITNMTDAEMSISDLSLAPQYMKYREASDASFWNSKVWLVLILSITILILIWLILKYLDSNIHNANILRLLGIIIILFMMGFIVLVINDTDQLSAIIGLLGAIAGYFLKEGQDIVQESSKNREEMKKILEEMEEARQINTGTLPKEEK